MSALKKEFYNLIVSAQQNDSEGNYGEAFKLYLHGINALSGYLKNECIIDHNNSTTNGKHLDDTDLDNEIRFGVKTLKNCVDRLEDIAIAHKNSNNNNNNNKVEKTSNVSPLEPIPVSNDSYIGKAYKENLLLNKIFEHRFRLTCDPLKRATLQLELQRRLTENIQLAKAKDVEKYHEMHLRERRTLEEAAKKLIQQQIVFNLDNESIASQQHLYAIILQYEEYNVSKAKQFRCQTLSVDHKTVKEIMDDILSDCDHPLAKWLRKFQYQITNRIEPLLASQKCVAEERNLLYDETTDTYSEFNNSGFNYEIKINQLESEALERHFHNIAADISNSHQTITLMLTLIMFDNQQYYTPQNSSLLQNQHLLIYFTAADYLYPPIWSAIQSLFRMVYYKDEEALKSGMHELYLFNDLKSICSDNIDPKLIEETALSLKSIIPLQSPHSKLKAMVRLTQKLCDNLKLSAESSAEVGADELVPALCLIALKSGIPSLMSECYAIEQLVDRQYLLGEEGYCLSSIQTALKYIIINSQNQLTLNND